MRFLALLAILGAIPIFRAMLRTPGGLKAACFLVGILPFSLNMLNLDFALVNWAGWPGYAKGAVITVLDSLSIAILIWQRRVFWKLPFRGVFLTYLAAITLSVFSSSDPEASSFYTFQLLRMFALYAAVAAIAQRPASLRWLLYGIASAAVLEGAVTLYQRLNGVFQAEGTMAHQNMLGLMLHFVTLPLFALLLSGARKKILVLGLAGSLLAVSLGASRATIGFLSGGLILLTVLSLWRSATVRKWKAVGLGLAAVALASPLAIQGLDQRFATAIEAGGYDERAAFERAAKMMLADHPLGVGANHYVVSANLGGYSERAGVAWNSGSRAAHVHNLYLLTGAEAGWLGILTLIALFAWPIWIGFKFALGERRDPRGDLVLGIAVAMCVTAVHNLYEWVFISYQAQYVFATGLGIIAGLTRQRQRERDALRQTSRARIAQSRIGQTEDGAAPGLQP